MVFSFKDIILGTEQKPPRNAVRPVRIGSVTIGGGRPVVVQSMCATKTADVEATVAQIEMLVAAGAGLVRLAVDSPADCRALEEIRRRCPAANLSVDLQESYRLAAEVAPWVDKIRYNPGHLHHGQREVPWQEKVRFIADCAIGHGCALRVGVNCGSVDPTKRGEGRGERGERREERRATISPLPLAGEGPGVRASGEVNAAQTSDSPHPSPLPKGEGTSISPRPLGEGTDAVRAMLESALEHCELLDRLGFNQYCVSLKDSDPARVIEVNRRFAALRPDAPLHLGVTEAGMPPEGIIKTRAALLPLLSQGIGDTIRVSLTVPAARKFEEVVAAQEMLADLAAGRTDAPQMILGRLNIISCPSCSRVENDAFVELAERVREATRYAADYPITIAVMGCRVNGPGETDHADLGLWCGRDAVHLKRGSRSLGTFSFAEVIDRLKIELDALITNVSPAASAVKIE